MPLPRSCASALAGILREFIEQDPFGDFQLDHLRRQVRLPRAASLSQSGNVLSLTFSLEKIDRDVAERETPCARNRAMSAMTFEISRWPILPPSRGWSSADMMEEGRQEPLFGMVDADQRFEADQSRHRRAKNLRLVMGAGSSRHAGPCARSSISSALRAGARRENGRREQVRAAAAGPPWPDTAQDRPSAGGLRPCRRVRRWAQAGARGAVAGLRALTQLPVDGAGYRRGALQQVFLAAGVAAYDGEFVAAEPSRNLARLHLAPQMMREEGATPRPPPHGRSGR